MPESEITYAVTKTRKPTSAPEPREQEFYAVSGDELMALIKAGFRIRTRSIRVMI